MLIEEYLFQNPNKLSSKPAAQCKAAIKEFEFCSLRTTK